MPQRSQVSLIERIHVHQSDLLCKKGCGYYGNPVWQGFCSKCWREEYRKARQKEIQEDWELAERLQREEEAFASSQSSQGAQSLTFSKFEEKKTNEKTCKVTTVKKSSVRLPGSYQRRENLMPDGLSLSPIAPRWDHLVAGKEGQDSHSFYIMPQPRCLTPLSMMQQEAPGERFSPTLYFCHVLIVVWWNLNDLLSRWINPSFPVLEFRKWMDNWIYHERLQSPGRETDWATCYSGRCYSYPHFVNEVMKT
nr:uncharacterized protein LOC129040873 [Pongo pygmaeus]